MSRGSRLALVPLLAVAFLLLGARAARACSCGPRGTVLDAYERAEVVVVVRAVSVRRAPKREAKPAEKSAGSGGQVKPGRAAVAEEDEGEPRSGHGGVITTTMVAERVFKGDVRPGDEMAFAQGGGSDCIYTFDEKDVGRRYLFYLGRFEGVPAWVAWTCGRSGLVEHRHDDLLYLNGLDKSRGRSRVSGTVRFDLADHPGLAGMRVRVSGAGLTREVRTDENGVYEIYDLPAGRYTLEPETPRGWRVSGFYLGYSASFAGDREADRAPKQIPFVLEEKKHAGLDLHFEVDNAVAGRIFDPAGRPMNGVCLDLVPAKEPPPGYSYEADCTEKGGEFRIEEIPPGSYVLVVNQEGKVTSSEPFGTLYYPNAARREDATVLHVGPGDFIENLEIRVPKTEETVTVEGLLLYSDGRPVADEWVRFRSEKNADPDEDEDAQAKTDARGRFSIKILKGMSGQLYGEFMASSGEFERCPAIERIIRASGDSVADVRTPAFEFRAETNLYGVELRYPFRPCKKARP